MYPQTTLLGSFIITLATRIFQTLTFFSFSCHCPDRVVRPPCHCQDRVVRPPCQQDCVRCVHHASRVRRPKHHHQEVVPRLRELEVDEVRKHYKEIHPSFEIPDNFKEMKDTTETSSKQILKKNFQRHLKNCGPKEEQQQLSQKRKLTDPDDEYGKPVRKKRDQQFSTQSGCNGHTKSLHLGEPKAAKKGKTVYQHPVR